MLILIEFPRDIASAQRKLTATIKREFPQRDNRTIGYQGGHVQDAQIQIHPNGYWFRHARDEGDKGSIPRNLNWFGRLQPGTLEIVVEINTVFEGYNGRVSGFFARDTSNGRVYLMHSGGLGGGTKGVGKTNFLAWRDERPVEVVTASGSVKFGNVVMPIEGKSASESAFPYLESIVTFKSSVKNNSIKVTDSQFKERKNNLKAYFDEAYGKRKRRNTKDEVDYFSSHGLIVAALRSWRLQEFLDAKQKIIKDQMLDLGVVDENGNMLEAYEVKTSIGRQDLYSAIGQVLVHASSLHCELILVLPSSDPLPNDISNALLRLNIQVLRFRLFNNKYGLKWICCNDIW